MRYFIEFSYHGKNYFGYQIQPNEISVQEVLEKALSTILRTPVKTIGAGRTDTGVHARKMFAHFDFDGEISGKLPQQLNSFLPADIAVKKIFEVPPEFHARFDASFRTYEYLISQEKNVFLTDFAWQLAKKLDVSKMNEACKILFDFDDFASFSKTGGDNKTTICKILQAKWEREDCVYKFTISADRFLRNMVRAIVGTMVDIGSGKIEPNDLKKIIEAKNRGNAGTSAPANGLYLVDVGYDLFSAKC